MEVPTISPSWTDKERLALIEYIAHDAGSRAFDGRPWLTPQEQFDLITVIAYIASKPARFCETNRGQLLAALSVPEPTP